MDGSVPAWMALGVLFAGVAAVTVGAGFLLLWQQATFGAEMKRRDDAFYARLREQEAHCQSEINLMRLGQNHRDEQIAQLLDTVKQHEQFLAGLGRIGLTNLNFSAGADVNIGGDVAGADKVTNSVGR